MDHLLVDKCDLAACHGGVCASAEITALTLCDEFRRPGVLLKHASLLLLLVALPLLRRAVRSGIWGLRYTLKRGRVFCTLPTVSFDLSVARYEPDTASVLDAKFQNLKCWKARLHACV